MLLINVGFKLVYHGSQHALSVFDLAAFHLRWNNLLIIIERRRRLDGRRVCLIRIAFHIASRSSILSLHLLVIYEFLADLLLLFFLLAAKAQLNWESKWCHNTVE